MESPFLCTAAYNVVYHQSPQQWFLYYVQENTMLFGRPCEANGRPFHCPSLFWWRVCPWGCYTLFSHRLNDIYEADAKVVSYTAVLCVERSIAWPHKERLFRRLIRKRTFPCPDFLVKWRCGYHANVLHRSPVLFLCKFAFISTVVSHRE